MVFSFAWLHGAHRSGYCAENGGRDFLGERWSVAWRSRDTASFRVSFVARTFVGALKTNRCRGWRTHTLFYWTLFCQRYSARAALASAHWRLSFHYPYCEWIRVNI